MRFRVRIEKPADLEPTFLDVALRDSIPRIVRLIEGKARVNLGGGLVQVRTGKTLAALRSTVSVTGSNPRGEVSVGGRRGHIGRLLETGVAPHEIVGRNGGLLTFRIAGEFLRKRVVRHPGVHARHWLTLAGEASIPDAERDLQRSIERAAVGQLTTRVTSVHE